MILRNEAKRRLAPIIEALAADTDLELLALEIHPDQVQLFVSRPPKNAPSLVANWCKGISARMYTHRCDDRITWSRSY